MKVCNSGARRYLNLTQQKGSLVCSSRSPAVSSKASEVTSPLSSFLENMLSDTCSLPHNSTHNVMALIFIVFFRKAPLMPWQVPALPDPRVHMKPVLESL